MTTTLPITTAQPFGPSYFVAGKNEATNSYLLKAAVYDSSNTLSGEVPFNVYFDGLTTNTSVATATLTVLTAPGPDAMNMPGSPEVVKTDVRTLTADKNGGFAFGLPNLSVALLEARA